ncbi:MAG TPA: M56 family metallopeptidase [Bryobacteraceae bacterium]|nr:M56 family metallopeptidase [Bryobacteraceae bacterium]
MTIPFWVDRLGWTLVHFLWQGALIAVLYAAARRMLREPQARYALACAALTLMIAAPIATFRILRPTEAAPANPYVGQIPVSSGPAAPSGQATATMMSVQHDRVMPAVVFVWMAGAIVFWIRLTGGWFIAARMRRTFVRQAPADWQRTLDRIRTRIGISRPVRLLVSALVQVPTVLGSLRPIVLMPVGALAGLPAEHVEMLLAHELAHIRRHDYLVNILQAIAEALLFYHPAVWWISGHIRAEREVCCDDVAVSVTGDAFTYACALADLESRRPEWMSPALAADGGSLQDRIGRLLNQPVRKAHPRSGAAVAATVLLAIGAWGLLAQSQLTRDTFEAVSIKPNDLGGGTSNSNSTLGRLDASMTTKSLIEMAFGLKRFQVSGGPGWMDEINYTIAATSGRVQLTRPVLEQCLQSLLADRFHLVYHRETREFPVYDLLAAKSGAKLKPAATTKQGTSSQGRNGAFHMTGTDLTMADFSGFLAGHLDRPVLDRTGIDGRYDVKLEWSSPEMPDASLPSLFSALQEQLGLRLEAAKGPVEILVVDSVDKPTETEHFQIRTVY